MFTKNQAQYKELQLQKISNVMNKWQTHFTASQSPTSNKLWFANLEVMRGASNPHREKLWRWAGPRVIIFGMEKRHGLWNFESLNHCRSRLLKSHARASAEYASRLVGIRDGSCNRHGIEMTKCFKSTFHTTRWTREKNLYDQICK